MQICVVTPSFNMGTYLEETIQSVIENLEPGDEYYVIDGGSTDRTSDVIANYEKALTGWVSEPDDGYADALRKGFSRSSAPLMCWINSGDILLPGALEYVRERFKCEKAELLFGDDYYINEEGRVLQQTRGQVHNLRNMMLYGGWTPLQDACFWTRTLYERCGGINPGLRYAADYDLFLKMSMVGRCEYYPAVLSGFRRHAAQKSIVEAQSYENERNSVQKSALRRCNEYMLFIYLKRVYYWLAVRTRAKISCLNRRSISLTGKNVRALTAERLC